MFCFLLQDATEYLLFWLVAVTPDIVGKCSSLTYGLFVFRIQKVELTLRRRIKSHLLFAGIIRSSPFSQR